MISSPRSRSFKVIFRWCYTEYDRYDSSKGTKWEYCSPPGQVTQTIIIILVVISTITTIIAITISITITVNNFK